MAYLLLAPSQEAEEEKRFGLAGVWVHPNQILLPSLEGKPRNLFPLKNLITGPVLIEHLCGLLILFHLHETALVGDIEKAFLQIGLNIPERDVTRFIWLKNPSDPELDNNIKILHFARIPFGVISSPFLLGATIQHHLKT